MSQGILVIFWLSLLVLPVHLARIQTRKLANVLDARAGSISQRSNIFKYEETGRPRLVRGAVADSTDGPQGQAMSSAGAGCLTSVAKGMDFHLHLGLGRVALGVVLPAMISNMQHQLTSKIRIILANRASRSYTDSLAMTSGSGTISLSVNEVVYASSVSILRSEDDLAKWLALTPEDPRSRIALLLFESGPSGKRLLSQVFPLARAWSTTLTTAGLIDLSDNMIKDSPEVFQCYGSDEVKTSITALENDELGIEHLRNTMEATLNLVWRANYIFVFRKGMVDRVCSRRTWRPLGQRKVDDSIHLDSFSLDASTEEFRGGIALEKLENMPPNLLCPIGKSILDATSFVPPATGGISCVAKDAFDFLQKLKLSFVNGMHTVVAFETLKLNENAMIRVNLQDRLEITGDQELSMGDPQDFEDSATLFSWYAARMLQLLLRFQEIVPSDSQESLLKGLWRMTNVNNLRLIDGAINIKDPVSRVLRGGVRTRLSGRVLPVLLDVHEAIDGTEAIQLLEQIVASGEQFYKPRGQTEVLTTSCTQCEACPLCRKKIKVNSVFSHISSAYLRYEVIATDATARFRAKYHAKDFEHLFSARDLKLLADPKQHNKRAMQLVQLRAGIDPGMTEEMSESFPTAVSHADKMQMQYVKDEYSNRFLDIETQGLHEGYTNDLYSGTYDAGAGDCLNSNNRMMRLKIKRVFRRLLKLRARNFANPSYVDKVGSIPYPHAYMVTQGSFSPYHRGHKTLARVGRDKILCQKYRELHTEQPERAEYECRPEAVLGIMGFSTDFNVMLKGSETLHLMIGERVKSIELLQKAEIESNRGVSDEDMVWLLPDTSNQFGVDPAAQARNSAQFAEESEILDIVFLIATLSDEFPEDVEKAYPNLLARRQQLQADPRYSCHLEDLRARHRQLDPDRTCDGDSDCLRRQLQIFEDLSNSELVSASAESRHYNNRLAAVSTNHHKTTVREEHSVYRDAWDLLPRGGDTGTSETAIDGQPDTSDASSTLVRRLIHPAPGEQSLEERAAELARIEELPLLELLYGLSDFFEDESQDTKVQNAYLNYKRANPAAAPYDIYTFIALSVGRPVPFRANKQVLERAVEIAKEAVHHGPERILQMDTSAPLIPGTKGEVFRVAGASLKAALSPYQLQQAAPFGDHELLVVKYAVEKKAGMRCAFSILGCKCDKNWNTILEHEKEASDRIHSPLTTEERTRALDSGLIDPNEGEERLRSFVEATFSTVVFSGSLRYQMWGESEEQGPDILWRERKVPAQMNAQKMIVMPGWEERPPLELLDIIKYSHGYENFPIHKEFPFADHAAFYANVMEQLLHAMSYLHEVKMVVHLDFIERNLLLKLPDKDAPSFQQGMIPKRFTVVVIDNGFVENLDSALTPGSNSLPDLQSTYPFAHIQASGRPAAKEIPADRMREMADHDVSILAARVMELLMFGYKRGMKNWAGDSSKGAFMPFFNEDKSPMGLGSAIFHYPSRDSIVKDILLRSDARKILRNKVLWGYENVFYDAPSGPHGKEFPSLLFRLIQDVTPWLNRISTRHHDWFEEQLEKQISIGTKLLADYFLAAPPQNFAAFIELWLRALYVDNVAAHKAALLGGVPTALELWKAIAKKDSNPVKDSPLTEQLVFSLQTFLTHVEGSDDEFPKDAALDLNGQRLPTTTMSAMETKIVDVLRSMYVDSENKLQPHPRHARESMVPEVHLLWKIADYIPDVKIHECSNRNSDVVAHLTGESLLSTATHVKHHEDLHSDPLLQHDMVFYAGDGCLSKEPRAYTLKVGPLGVQQYPPSNLTGSVVSRINRLRAKYAPYLQFISTARRQASLREKGYPLILVSAATPSHLETAQELADELSRRYVRRANVELHVERAGANEKQDYLFSVAVGEHTFTATTHTFSFSGDIESFFEDLAKQRPELVVDNGGKPSAKYAGFSTKSFLKEVVPWQSSLISRHDISITKKPPRKRVSPGGRKAEHGALPEIISESQLEGPVHKNANLSSIPLGSILVLGDSHVEYGVNFGSAGWANHLRRTQGLVSVLNLGASGYNTQHALDHVSPVAQEMLRSSRQTGGIKLTVLMYGSIDSYRADTIKQTMRVEPDDYKRNLIILANDLLQANPDVPLLMLSPPAPNEKLMKIAWTNAFEGGYDAFYRFKSVDETIRYQQATREAADTLKKQWGAKVRFADATKFSMKDLMETDFMDDGLHFNAAGNLKFHSWLEHDVFLHFT